MLGFAFALALFVMPFVGHAKSLTQLDCPSLDYSSEMGPIRNQDNTDWCWAFSGADLITAFQKSPEPVSAVDVAISAMAASPADLAAARAHPLDFRFYQKMKSRLELEKEGAHEPEPESEWAGKSLRYRSGSNEVLLYNLRERLCYESELPSQAPRAFAESARFGQGLFSTKEGVSFIAAQLRSLGDLSIDEVPGLELSDPYGTCRSHPELMIPGLSLFQAYNQKVLLQVNERVKSACKRGPPVRPMKTQVEDVAAEDGIPSKAGALAARWLREGSPLRMNYDGNFFVQAKFKPSREIKINHSSVVAGMRWNQKTKTCDFKIRGSWGPDCAAYPKKFRKRCTSGSVWISQIELESVTGVIDRIVADRSPINPAER
jgi:hypothetical protein